MFRILVVSLFVSSCVFAAGNMALVNVAKLEKSEVNSLQEFVGTVNFKTKSQIASESSGVIEKINFKVGDEVKRGQTLLSIDSKILDSQIDALNASLKIAENELENSKKDYERYTKLLETKSISQKNFDDMFLKYNVSNSNLIYQKAKLEELKVQKSKKSIYAPYSGIIVSKDVNIAEWLNSGKNVATIVDKSSLEVTFNVPLNIANGVASSSDFEINIANNSYKLSKAYLIPNGDKLTRTFPVKFYINDISGFVFDGMEAKTQFAQNSKIEALLINRDAVIKRFNMDIVFAIVDNVAKMIPVKTVGYSGKDIAISGDGLVEGMNIVVKGNERVFPNQPVQVLEN